MPRNDVTKQRVFNNYAKCYLFALQLEYSYRLYQNDDNSQEIIVFRLRQVGLWVMEI